MAGIGPRDELRGAGEGDRLRRVKNLRAGEAEVRPVVVLVAAATEPRSSLRPRRVGGRAAAPPGEVGAFIIFSWCFWPPLSPALVCYCASR